MKKYFLMASILLMALLPLTACSRQGNRQDTGDNSTSDSLTVAEKIDAREAKDIMDASEDYVLLDVRTQEEYDEGHIEGAILIPDYEITKKAEAILDNKDATILVYCRSGRRSALAAQALIDLGYTKVYDFGGIIDWPYAVVTK